MSIADMFLQLVILLTQQTILKLPASLPIFTIDSYAGLLDNINSTLNYAYVRVGSVFPVNLILILILAVLVAETSLLIFKAGVFVVNLIRGSGA